MFVLSGFLDEYSPDFAEQISGAKKLGLKNIELRFADGINVANFSEKKVEEIKALLIKENVFVSSIGSPIGKISLDDDFNEHLNVAEKIFKTANQLDCKLIRIFSFYLKGRTREQSFKLVAKWLQQVLGLADKFSVTLCLENEEGLYGESPESCLELCKYFNGRLKSVFDMGNFLLCGYEPYNVASNLLKDYIEYFHIKDALSAGAIVPPGVGEANIKEILATHKNYKQGDIFVTLEPHLQTFDGLNALASKSFDNPYKYENQQVAFLDAFNKLKELL